MTTELPIAITYIPRINLSLLSDTTEQETEIDLGRQQKTPYDRDTKLPIAGQETA